MTREEIGQIGTSRPDNILQTVPGVSVDVRGMQDFGRTNVSIDGARQTFQYTTAGPLGGIVNFRTLELDDILTGGRDWGGGSDRHIRHKRLRLVRHACGRRPQRPHFRARGALTFRNSGRYRDGNGVYADQTGQDLVSGLAKVGSSSRANRTSIWASSATATHSRSTRPSSTPASPR